MQSVAEDLESRLTIAARLRQLDEEAASSRGGPDQWSAKETIGHLIDSAANNHQRFVRLQTHGHLELPGYEGDVWVRVQHYQTMAWSDIVQLWESYNRHLIHLIRNLDPATLSHTWRSPEGEVVTLEFIVRDYVVHMQQHLDELFKMTTKMKMASPA
jgi:hypothetical protein